MLQIVFSSPLVSRMNDHPQTILMEVMIIADHSWLKLSGDRGLWRLPATCSSASFFMFQWRSWSCKTEHFTKWKILDWFSTSSYQHNCRDAGWEVCWGELQSGFLSTMLRSEQSVILLWVQKFNLNVLVIVGFETA